MDSRRRSAWLWCLVAACSKLLLMAAAATDDPELRATRRARGECDWVAKHFVIEDDAAKFPLSVKATITREAEPNPIHIHLNMTSASGLYNLRRQLLMTIGELHRIGEISLKVTQKEIFATVKSKKKRTGKHAIVEGKTRGLSAILYGKDSAGRQHQEAEWDEEAHYFMAKNPVCAAIDAASLPALTPHTCLLRRRRSVATSARARPCTARSGSRTT